MNFVHVNFFGWVLIILQILVILAAPTKIGKPKEDWNYGDFIGSIIGLVLLAFALGII